MKKTKPSKPLKTRLLKSAQTCVKISHKKKHATLFVKKFGMQTPKQLVTIKCGVSCKKRFFTIKYQIIKLFKNLWRAIIEAKTSTICKAAQSKAYA